MPQWAFQLMSHPTEKELAQNIRIFHQMPSVFKFIYKKYLKKKNIYIYIYGQIKTFHQPRFP